MYVVKLNTESWVPTVLTSAATGELVTGVVAADLVVYTYKDGAGAPVLKTLVDVASFIELSAANMPGTYLVRLSAAELDTVGFFVMALRGNTVAQTTHLLRVEPLLTADLNDALAALLEVRGLTSKANFQMTNTMYTTIGNKYRLTSATLHSWAKGADVAVDPAALSVAVNIAYDAEGRMVAYTSVEV